MSARCYLCGVTGILTRDHVPPRGFFPPPRPANLITVPCCQPCNSLYSKDDEAARLWFSSLVGSSEAGQWIFQNKVLANTVRRSPALRDAFLANAQDTVLNTVEGDLDVTRVEVPTERVERFIIRLTKGLLHHHFPEYDHAGAAFEVRHIPSAVENLTNLTTIKESLEYDQRGEGVFQYRRGLTDSKQSGLWLFVFYEAVIFLVGHSKNNWGKPIGS